MIARRHTEMTKGSSQLTGISVTLGMCLIGSMSWFRGLVITVSQIAGAISSAGIVSLVFPGPLVIRTSLGGGTRVVQGLFIEMFLTAQLVFTIFMLAAEKHKATYIAPIGIGLSLFIAELTGIIFSPNAFLASQAYASPGVYHTGGSVNPARSLGPCIILHSFHTYHWVVPVGLCQRYAVLTEVDILDRADSRHTFGHSVLQIYQGARI